MLLEGTKLNGPLIVIFIIFSQLQSFFFRPHSLSATISLSLYLSQHYPAPMDSLICPANCGKSFVTQKGLTSHLTQSSSCSWYHSYSKSASLETQIDHQELGDEFMQREWGRAWWSRSWRATTVIWRGTQSFSLCSTGFRVSDWCGGTWPFYTSSSRPFGWPAAGSQGARLRWRRSITVWGGTSKWRCCRLYGPISSWPMAYCAQHLRWCAHGWFE